MSDSFEYITKMVKFAEGILGLAQEHGVVPKKPGRKAAAPTARKGRPKGSKNKGKVAAAPADGGNGADEGVQADG